MIGQGREAEAGICFLCVPQLEVTSGEEPSAADSSSPCSLEGGASAARQTQVRPQAGLRTCIA